MNDQERAIKALTDISDIGEAQYAARAALVICREMAAREALIDDSELQNAIWWLCVRGVEALERTENQVLAVKHLAAQAPAKG